MKTSCRMFIGILIFFSIIRIPLLSAENHVDQICQAIQDHGANWKAGENWVTRLSKEEQRVLCGAILVPEDVSIAPIVQFERVELPESFDWRDNGGNWITSIKNQGNCGSCWDFAAIAQVEAWWKIYNTNLDSMIDLSEQFVLSCSGAGNCIDGGATYLALEFIKNFGVPSEACLPYEADDTVPCGSACADWQNEAVTIPGWGWVTLDEPYVEVIKQAIYRSPISAYLEVYADLPSYSEGVYEHVYGDFLDGHMILIVGWDDAERCWICKNSWGPTWGENGYFRIRWGECLMGQYTTCVWSNVLGEGDYSVTLESDKLTLTTGDSTEFPLTIQNTGTINLDCAILEMGHRILFHADNFMAYDGMSIWCGDPELGGYPNWFMEHLDTPLLDLSGTTNPKLTFMTRWAIEEPSAWGGPGSGFDGWDGCNVWISIDGGKNFTTILPSSPLYTCTNLFSYSRASMMFWGFEDPVPGWGGFSSGWVPAEFDLSGFTADSVVIRFSFAADEGWSTINQSNLTGFFIDEIQVTDNGQIFYENQGDSLDGMHITGYDHSMQADWLNLGQNYASIAPGDSIEIPIYLNTHALEPGLYSGILCLSVNDTTGLMNSVPFTLTLEPAEHDISLKSILSPGEYMSILRPLTPQVQIKNIGQNTESGFGLALEISSNNTPIASDTVFNLILESMQSMTISFDPLLFDSPANYDMNIYPVLLPEDNNLYNNQLQSQLIVSNLIDDFESGLMLWSIEGNWLIEDSPSGNESQHCAFISAKSDSDAVLTFNLGLDLTPVDAAMIQYWAHTRLDKQICYFEISTDSLTWTRVDSVNVNESWELHKIDLTPSIQAGQNWIWFRFYYATEGPCNKFGVRIDDIEIYPESVSDIEPVRIPSPYTWKLSRNYPNPFNPITTIEYSVAKEGEMRISVYDLLGRHVRTLVDMRQKPGDYRTTWDGCNDSGLAVASGVYLIYLESKEIMLNQKVLLLK